VSTSQTDEELFAVILESLVQDGRLSAQLIDVSVVDSIATLAGTVQSYRRKHAAVEITESIDGCCGVQEIYNLLAIEPSLEIEHEQLGRSINCAFSHTSGLRNTDVRVAVTGVTATLSGHVDELWQNKRAEQMARRLPVVAVNNDISLR
jgi:osmotically-inducible protein OsmY